MGEHYTDQYIDQVFYLWYEGGKKLSNELINTLPPSTDGNKPSKATVGSWIPDHGWAERADALDAEVSRSIEEKIITKRTEMWERQAELAKELIDIGMNFLKDPEKGGIKNDASAIRAIDLGMSTQRISTGMAEAMVRIGKMNDEQLTTELQKLLGRPTYDADAEIIGEDE